MHICIVGAGFTGLAASYYLSKLGHKVTVFEKEKVPGGLAIGFKDKNWSWSLEAHYHHLFTSDNSIRNLAKEVGHEIIFTTPKTSTLYGGEIHKFDTPLSLLKFPHFTLIDKLRAGATIAYLRITNNWGSLENKYAKKFLLKTMGNRVWKILWEPLFNAKFGKFADKVTASWFWARIKKRSASLGYPRKGFLALAKSVQKSSEKLGTKFYFQTSVVEIKRKGKNLFVVTNNKREQKFDAVIFTLPTHFFLQITKGLSLGYKKKVRNLDGLGAVNLVLAIKDQFLKDNTYWLNVNDQGYPFLAVVEHTNFIDKKKYGGDRLLYIGNYLEKDHPYFYKSANELLKEFIKSLKRINPEFNKSWVRKAWKFTAPFAQPVPPLNYSRYILPHTTPIEGVYLANIQQVYPWDRGTNYAVEMGEKVAKMIHEKETQ